MNCKGNKQEMKFVRISICILGFTNNKQKGEDQELEHIWMREELGNTWDGRKGFRGDKTSFQISFKSYYKSLRDGRNESNSCLDCEGSLYCTTYLLN